MHPTKLLQESLPGPGQAEGVAKVLFVNIKGSQLKPAGCKPVVSPKSLFAMSRDASSRYDLFSVTC